MVLTLKLMNWSDLMREKEKLKQKLFRNGSKVYYCRFENLIYLYYKTNWYIIVSAL